MVSRSKGTVFGLKWQSNPPCFSHPTKPNDGPKHLEYYMEPFNPREDEAFHVQSMHKLHPYLAGPLMEKRGRLEAMSNVHGGDERYFSCFGGMQ